MLGHQLVVDLFDCDPTILDDLNKIEGILATVVGHLNARVIQILTHSFSPHGTTCLALISTSHVAIHTWPENRFTSIDIFSCGAKINIPSIMESLKNVFGASRAQCCEVFRGNELSSPFFSEE